LRTYDAQIEDLTKQLTADGLRTTPGDEILRGMIEGLAAAWPMQKIQQETSAAADTLVQASVSDQKQRLLFLAFQLRRILAEIEKGSQALDPKLRWGVAVQVTNLKRLVDGPESIIQLRQHELDLIADVRGLLTENTSLSSQLTDLSEELVVSAKREV